MNEIKKINELFDEIKTNITNLQKDSNENYIKALDIFQFCEGKLIFTGVGKSGLIAKKIAASYSSTGNPSIFLDPIQALHGDLGIVDKKDVLVLLSHSGNTDELLAILPSIKNLGNKIISITSNENSKLAKESDIHINTLVKKEICPHNLAPTTSTLITMTILDVLMVLLMQRKNFQRENFALFHPAGSLGKRLILKISDLMESQIFYCSLNNSIVDLINIMTKGGKGLVPILNDNQKLVGIVTDGDLRRAMNKFEKEIFSKKIEEIMTKNPRSVDSEALAVDVLNMMETSEFTAIPVLENGKLKGVLNIHDILKSGVK